MTCYHFKSTKIAALFYALLVLVFSANTIRIRAASNDINEPERVWLAPAFPFPGKPGLDEILLLFKDDRDWSKARSHLNIFKIYTHAVLSLTNEQLKEIVDYLKRHKIALAIEYGMLAFNEACGRGVEGFQPPKMPTLIANKIKSLGGEIKYIAMDEPLFYGRHFEGEHACKWNLDEIAKSAASNVAQFRAIFPDVVVGEIEPVATMHGEWSKELEEWFNLYRKVTGTPIAFFHFDMVWRGPFIENTREALRVLKSNDIPFGVIFNSRGNITSDVQWSKSATANLKAYFLARLPKPKDVVIQSWRPYPTRVLPESDPTTLTYLVNYYFSSAK